MRHERHAVGDVDCLLFYKRRSAEEGDELIGVCRALDERRAVTAQKPAHSHRRAELSAVDPANAPEIAECICFEFLEKDEWTELLVRTVFRRHTRRTPRLFAVRGG